MECMPLLAIWWQLHAQWESYSIKYITDNDILGFCNDKEELPKCCSAIAGKFQSNVMNAIAGNEMAMNCPMGHKLDTYGI